MIFCTLCQRADCHDLSCPKVRIAIPPKDHLNMPKLSLGSTTVIRDGRARKPGRPRVPIEIQRLKARERQRKKRAK